MPKARICRVLCKAIVLIPRITRLNPVMRFGIKRHLRPVSYTHLDVYKRQMQGRYDMLADDGTRFDAPIATFTLSVPRTLH